MFLMTIYVYIQRFCRRYITLVVYKRKLLTTFPSERKERQKGDIAERTGQQLSAKSSSAEDKLPFLELCFYRRSVSFCQSCVVQQMHSWIVTQYCKEHTTTSSVRTLFKIGIMQNVSNSKICIVLKYLLFKLGSVIFCYLLYLLLNNEVK